MALDEPMTPVYRAVITITHPVMRPWSRLRVSGLEHVPSSGPTLLVSNHDSYWDPIAIGVAARSRRQVRALSKSTIWKYRPIAAVMNGMGHIPIERGKGDAQAMDEAIRQLRGGVCIGIFPEGTRSLGRELRARSGAGRLALAVPEAQVVCCRVNGTTDVARAPHRPTISVEFFRPDPARPDEDAGDLSARWLAAIRADAPRSVPGRARTERKYRARLRGPEAR